MAGVPSSERGLGVGGVGWGQGAGAVAGSGCGSGYECHDKHTDTRQTHSTATHRVQSKNSITLCT